MALISMGGFFGTNGIKDEIGSYKDFIEYELGIDPSFISHADEALVAIANLCGGEDKDFIENLRKFMCYGAEGAEQFFSDPEFYTNLNGVLQSVSTAADLIDPELISFFKSGIESLSHLAQFFSPELQESLIGALDTVSKVGSAIDGITTVISTIKPFIDENTILVYGVGGPIAALLLIAYIKYSSDGKQPNFKELSSKLDELETEIKGIHITSVLHLRMSAVNAAIATIPRSSTASQRRIIEKGKGDAIRILEVTAPYATNFIQYLNHTQHQLAKHSDKKMKSLPDIEKLNYSGNVSNVGMFLNLMYSGRLKEFRIKPSNINYNTILQKVKDKRVLSQKCENLQGKMKNQMHNLYWAVLRNVSTPKDLISLLMKDAYSQRKGMMDEFKSPEGIDLADIKKACEEFNVVFKKDYHDFLNVRWHKDDTLNEIYGEALFLRSFLAFNLGISYKLANYSFAYTTRQAYLGLEDVGRPLLHPITTVQNLFFLGRDILLHPIETPTKIVKEIGKSIWNQPIRLVTKLAGDILLMGGAETLVSSAGLKLTSASAPAFIGSKINYVGSRSVTVAQTLVKGTTAGSSKLIKMAGISNVGLGASSAVVLGARVATITPVFTRLSSAHKNTLPPLDSSSIANVEKALETYEKCVKKDLVAQLNNSETRSTSMLLRSGKRK